MDILKKIVNEEGGSLIEFAIITPLLFVMLFGIIELALVLYDQAIITNASREGAREGILFTDPRRTINEIQVDVTSVVNNYCNNGDYLVSFGESTPTVTVNSTGNVTGDSLTVTVNYTYASLAFSSVIRLLGGSFGDANGNINLRAVSIMRME
jgi:Flp pilus assembly protein TadG